LMRAYRDAWKSFYGKDHLRTLLLRRKGPRRRLLFSSLIWFCGSVFLEDVHPLLGGFFRFKGRKSRRSSMPREAFLPYYVRRTKEIVFYVFGLIKTIWELWILFKYANRPENKDYMDVSIAPIIEDKIRKPSLSTEHVKSPITV